MDKSKPRERKAAIEYTKQQIVNAVGIDLRADPCAYLREGKVRKRDGNKHCSAEDRRKLIRYMGDLVDLKGLWESSIHYAVNYFDRYMQAHSAEMLLEAIRQANQDAPPCAQRTEPRNERVYFLQAIAWVSVNTAAKFISYKYMAAKNACEEVEDFSKSACIALEERFLNVLEWHIWCKPAASLVDLMFSATPRVRLNDEQMHLMVRTAMSLLVCSHLDERLSCRSPVLLTAAAVFASWHTDAYAMSRTPACASILLEILEAADTVHSADFNPSTPTNARSTELVTTATTLVSLYIEEGKRVEAPDDEFANRMRQAHFPPPHFEEMTLLHIEPHSLSKRGIEPSTVNVNKRQRNASSNKTPLLAEDSEAGCGVTLDVL